MEHHAKIFLVEDEALNAFYMTVELRKMGFKVHTTLATGEAVVACTERERPDLILMDINLSGEMNGIEAVKRIKERFDVQVIFITGYSDPEIMERANALNPVAFLVKPVDFKELKKKMLSALAVPS